MDPALLEVFRPMPGTGQVLANLARQLFIWIMHFLWVKTPLWIAVFANFVTREEREEEEGKETFPCPKMTRLTWLCKAIPEHKQSVTVAPESWIHSNPGQYPKVGVLWMWNALNYESIIREQKTARRGHEEQQLLSFSVWVDHLQFLLQRECWLRSLSGEWDAAVLQAPRCFRCCWSRIHTWLNKAWASRTVTTGDMETVEGYTDLSCTLTFAPPRWPHSFG